MSSIWRSISTKIQCSISYCTLQNLSYILCLSFEFALAILLFCIQHSTLIYATFKSVAFDIQLFISSSQVFEFDLQVQWNVHSFFLHPTFSICPLRFRFPHPTLSTVVASFRIRHSTFRIELLPAGQRAMEIVGSIDLTHLRSNSGRESVERLPSGVDSGDLLHSRQLDVDRRVHDRVIKAADRQDAAAPAN